MLFCKHLFDLSFAETSKRNGQLRNSDESPWKEDALCIRLELMRIAYLENGVKTPSLPILVDLANALHISVDVLLVDSLDYSLSSSDSNLHRLLLDCDETEQTVIIRMAEELKATLVSLGI